MNNFQNRWPFYSFLKIRTFSGSFMKLHRDIFTKNSKDWCHPIQSRCIWYGWLHPVLTHAHKIGKKVTGKGLASRQTLVSSINHGIQLRILRLGDSITFGYNEPSGNWCRRFLENLLWAGGNAVNLIGSISNGDWTKNQSDGFIYHTIDEIQRMNPVLEPKVIW